ncbi:MAG TPA: ABC transporter ATP-binding protein [Acidimicrobiia bacterium]
MLRRLLRDHLRPYKKTLWLIVLLQTVQTTAALTLPTINASIIDNGVLHHVGIPPHVRIVPDQGYIFTWGGIMLVFAFIQIVFAIGAVYFGGKVAMSFGRDLRRNLFHGVTDFSAREVGTFGAPSLITRITNDVQQVQMLVVMAVTMAVAAPITMVVGVILALRQDVGLSGILVVAMPVAAIVLGIVVAKMVPAYGLMQDRIDSVNRVLREQITGIRVVRAFVREPQESARFEKANADLTEVSLFTGRLQSSMFPTVNLLINISSVAVLWIGANRVSSGAIEPGTLVAYLTYLVQILMSVVMATFMVSMIPRAAVSAERIQEVLDTDPSVVPPSETGRGVDTHGLLEFRDVAFHYPGAEHSVLTDVSFTTTPGHTTAIVGSTGAGKTTLANLVLRLFDATAGDVLVGGVNVRELDPDVLWNTIGYVPQRPYLFSGTIASNLRFGKPDATEDEMWTALEVAQAADFVRNMPGGLRARIEQGGTNVSGGQRQRLAIARALVRQPDIYVFDDSFSALDLATDARLRAALVPYTRAAAMIVVAQRVSTIVSADEIIVLEDGEVIGRGRHDDLVVSCPTYAEIVESQIGEKSAA